MQAVPFYADMQKGPFFSPFFDVADCTGMQFSLFFLSVMISQKLPKVNVSRGAYAR